MLYPALRQYAKAVWNPDIAQPINFFEGWSKVPEQETYDNAFKVQWELFLKHVVKGDPFRWDLREGVKGVQLQKKDWRAGRKEVGWTFLNYKNYPDESSSIGYRWKHGYWFGNC
jgi:hypothetical protein